MTEITEDNISEFLSQLGFSLESGEESTYSKRYKKHNNYKIKIEINTNDFGKTNIDYGDKIKKDRETTCNFSQAENLVVLECVNRLLEKGYSPEKIILEKKFPLGHEYKGYLDIQVLDSSKNSFLMIECKTYGKEYKKEINNMYANGGLLFTYFHQDKKTKYLCLYTSIFDGKSILYENSIIKITNEIKKGENVLDCFESWKPQVFEEKGVFEESITPYNIEFIYLRKNELKPLTKDDGGDIFNRFAEILRKNVVSDKTNAYNKIFNLFLCKIVDEYERTDKDILKFQWQNSETNEEVLLRLNELYKQGMKEYLDLEISSVDLDEIEKQLQKIRTEKDKEKIKRLFIEQKLYTSNDFAFKEVFDKNTFDQNCVVVKEVVKLLEKYKIKYETKQQFLGDFFEKLLNTGIKQEVGQYFTPVPIAQFICKSLPIWDIIKEKNDKKEIYFLPYCIDFASGAGHFLTEIMEEINYYIENKITDSFIKNGRAKKEFTHHKNNFNFAKKYIYGIEKDYRLAKTTKIATFLNGDGDAVIICGDGLDNFNYSKDYKEKLKKHKNTKNNNEFDIVIANPPYSVSGFKTTINYGRESFELFDEFTEKSKEIECLFVERTAQLLREGGVAGIVLPTSVLEGEKVYAKVREMILDNFEIKGIVKFGKDTFMATNTATIVLFLKKIKSKKEDILFYLQKSINQHKDLTINKVSKPITNYLKKTHKIPIEKYFKLLNNDDIKNKELNQLKIYNFYSNLFKKQNAIKKLSDFIKQRETNKLLYFILAYNHKIVFYNIPLEDAKEHKKILGYEFSERRGYEGINILNLGGTLYNPNKLNDEQKVNHYILSNFKGKELEIKDKIPYLSILNLHEMIEFNNLSSSKVINISKYETRKDKVAENARKALLKLNEQKIAKKVGELIRKYSKKTKIRKMSIKSVLKDEIQTGGTPHTRNKEFWENGTINWLKIGDMEGKYIYGTEKKITKKGKENKGLKLYDEGTILFSIFGTIGKIGILKIKTTLNQAICALVPNTEIVTPDYLYYILLGEKDKIIKSILHRTQDNLNQTKLGEWEIPIIEEIKKQEEFLKEIMQFEKDLS